MNATQTKTETRTVRVYQKYGREYECPPWRKTGSDGGSGFVTEIVGVPSHISDRDVIHAFGACSAIRGEHPGEIWRRTIRWELVERGGIILPGVS